MYLLQRKKNYKTSPTKGDSSETKCLFQNSFFILISYARNKDIQNEEETFLFFFFSLFMWYICIKQYVCYLSMEWKGT